MPSDDTPATGVPRPAVMPSPTPVASGTATATAEPVVDDSTPVAAPQPTAVVDTIDAPAAAAPGGFAPPTMDIRAEVIYARLAEEHAKATGKPSVVFVDDAAPETPQSRSERAGALRRLISSIRSGR